ncbi:unnamed protein product, partial [Chrysoparadoxa australica]
CSLFPQVLDERGVPEPSFARRGRVRNSLGTVIKSAKRFRERRKGRGGRRGVPKLTLPFAQKGKGEGKGYGSMGEDSRQHNHKVNTRSVATVQRRKRARGDDAKINVLILMSDTGGGHRASAQAIEAAFEDLYEGEINVDMVDIWTEHSAWPTSHSVPAYQYAAKNPMIWRALYEYSRFPPTRWWNDKVLHFRNFKRFTECIQEYEPDLVISVHPLCQTLPLRVLKAMGEGGRRELPFVTVVTDLGGAHPTWFDKEADKVFIASEAVMRVAFHEGVSVSQIHDYGLPIRPAFWDGAMPKEQLRAELGIPLEPKAAMVVGGGDGVGGMSAIAAAVIRRLGKDMEQATVVVICGKNAAVKAELENTDWPSNVNVIINGFVSNMDQWMGAVDCIVTKAGPGTIAEAAIRGLPIMLSGYLPGQEEGNVPFVVDGGFGDFSRKPQLIASKVSDWFRNPEMLQRMSAAAIRAAKPNATYDIAREIGSMMFPVEGELV